MNAVHRVVLDLLVSKSALATADAWDHTLRPRLERLRISSANERSADAPLTTERVVDAVETIVPQLADYKTFYENLYGLLEFCQQQCLDKLFNVACKWLTTTKTSVAFRRWMYEYVDRMTVVMVSVNPRQWKQALLVAALKEENAELKHLILKLIDRVGLDSVIDPQPHTPSPLSSLLLFFWQNAANLIQATTLCAAKVVALTREPIVPDPSTIALLRWGRVLKPLFFHNFVDMLLTLHAIRRPSELELCVPPAIELFFNETVRLRSCVQQSLDASQHQLQSALERKVPYLYRPASARAPWIDRCTSISVISDDVISYLRNDLADLPTAVFPSVFAAFAVAAASALDKPPTSGTVKLVVESLLGLLMLRIDTHSLVSVLSVVFDLRVAALSFWKDNSPFFQRIIQELSETVILETDQSKRWVLHIALQHLVLEGDLAVLHQHAAFLCQRLPRASNDLVRLRIGDRHDDE